MRNLNRIDEANFFEFMRGHSGQTLYLFTRMLPSEVSHLMLRLGF